MPSTLLIDMMGIFFPSTCAGCAVALIPGEDVCCLACVNSMPYARMHDLAFNVMESRLLMRFHFVAATSMLFFVKDGKVQQMLHRLKYHGEREVGLYLGDMLARQLRASQRYQDVAYVVPVPLHSQKLRSRGFNQTGVIAEGMAEHDFQCLPHVLERLENTDSQTRKSMSERWENVKGGFMLRGGDELKGKKVLLLDDVLTTGATLEACAEQLLKIEGIELYVATIACAEFG